MPLLASCVEEDVEVHSGAAEAHSCLPEWDWHMVGGGSASGAGEVAVFPPDGRWVAAVPLPVPGVSYLTAARRALEDGEESGGNYDWQGRLSLREGHHCDGTQSATALAWQVQEVSLALVSNCARMVRSLERLKVRLDMVEARVDHATLWDHWGRRADA